jgi:hypothetical protein
MNDTELDAAIAAVESAGLAVVKPRNRDESVCNMWSQVYGLLRMMSDLVDDGARLTINHPSCFAPTADVVALARAGMLRHINQILATAVVVREERDAA